MLKSKENPFVSTHTMHHHEHLLVGDLIDQHSHNWNVDQITSLFNNVDSAAIFSIPLLNPIDEDKMLSKFSTNGAYSVRTT